MKVRRAPRPGVGVGGALGSAELASDTFLPCLEHPLEPPASRGCEGFSALTILPAPARFLMCVGNELSRGMPPRAMGPHCRRCDQPLSQRRPGRPPVAQRDYGAAGRPSHPMSTAGGERASPIPCSRSSHRSPSLATAIGLVEIVSHQNASDGLPGLSRRARRCFPCPNRLTRKRLLPTSCVRAGGKRECSFGDPGVGATGYARPMEVKLLAHLSGIRGMSPAESCLCRRRAHNRRVPTDGDPLPG